MAQSLIKIATVMNDSLPMRLRVEATLLTAAFGSNDKLALELCDSLERLLSECAGPAPEVYAEEFRYYETLISRVRRILT